jgi:hypothetical protein
MVEMAQIVAEAEAEAAAASVTWSDFFSGTSDPQYRPAALTAAVVACTTIACKGPFVALAAASSAIVPYTHSAAQTRTRSHH